MMECDTIECADVKEACQELPCTRLLEFLIHDKFPGQVIVTASLRARSIIVQHMLAEIEPNIPIVYCNAGKVFPESAEYQDNMIKRLGFTNVQSPVGQGEVQIAPGDHDHIEWVKARYDRNHGATQEAMHLNATLSGYKCWISAVYHYDQDSAARSRVEREGLLLRVNPLLDWDQDRVSDYMTEFELPYHRLAKVPVDMNKKHGDGTDVMTFAF
ncbi:MAG: phosphoadenosine phosphosulfate reductase family protein [Alphaproteobacteria bacterium]|nr:phosphoadenosine phosphosulfate reductase family protein [Alphaproteobacteria bacterium]MBF0250826.1 phosphoadenosine phosphosulfate reductase family protein [Alphaproteobacteria bacterium]